MAYTTRTTCRVCNSPDLTPLFSLGSQFVSDFVPADRIHSGSRCPIDLELCRGCGLVQMKHTAPCDFLYTRHYWYRSGVTETMRAALADVAAAAERVVDLRAEDVVLDIGSNDGTLLRSYTAIPVARWDAGPIRVGVEPATNLAEEGHRGVDYLVPDFWSLVAYDWYFRSISDKWQAGPKARVVTAAGMFYDLESPNDFIRDVARVLAPDGVFIAQLMCLKQTIEMGDVGNFAHEHVEFYSLRSLDTLFGRHGLEIFDIEENAVNGGSYRLFVRHRGASVSAVHGQYRANAFRAMERSQRLDDPDAYVGFISQLETNRRRLHGFISDAARSGKRVHVLGASTKGNVILQWACLDHTLIEAASDRSPEKHGLYTVGTGIPIVSEEESRRMKPDFYLCLPYAFKAELVARESAWRAGGGKFIFPLPSFEVV